MPKGGVRPGSGRPKGVPNKATADIKALAQKHGKAAIDKLVKMMDSDDERTIIAASKELLDRGYGKAPQAITGEGGEGPVTIVVETGIRRD
jgi:hypothetical protein